MHCYAPSYKLFNKPTGDRSPLRVSSSPHYEEETSFTQYFSMLKPALVETPYSPLLVLTTLLQGAEVCLLVCLCMWHPGVNALFPPFYFDHLQRLDSTCPDIFNSGHTNAIPRPEITSMVSDKLKTML